MVLSGPTGDRHIDGEVVLDLKEAHRNIIKNESKLKLMETLLDYGLCTRDIYSFACKQVDLCETLHKPDRRTITSAMKMKIRDLKQTIKFYHRVRRRNEMLLLKECGGKSWKLKKIIRAIKKSVREENIDTKTAVKHETKIEHYKKTMERLHNLDEPNGPVSMDEMNKIVTGRGGITQPVDMDGMNKTSVGGGGVAIDVHDASVIPTIPPRNLQDFSTSSIFNAPEDLPDPIQPMGPFITSSDIKLSESEKNLLSKDPKYSLVYPPTKLNFATEIERMNAKVRYNDNSNKFSEKKKSLNRITDCNGMPINWPKGEAKYTGSDVKNNGETLGDMFRECKDRFVFNPLDKTIDFSTQRATDYKLNRSVKLPKPMDANKELQCEIRRTQYLKAFDKYEEEICRSENDDRKKRKLRKKDNIKSQHNKKKNCGKENLGTKTQKKGGRANHPLNLNKKESEALKNLKKRIKEGEIIISQTDKSSRFAVLTKKQYLDAGKVHTSKDKEITWKEVKYIQSQINAHVWWITNALGYGEKTDPSRVMKNFQNHSLEIPDMAILVKDHKMWDPSSNKPVPTRPVVSGNRGVNTHLSEMVSELLEPLVLEMGGG